MGKRRPALAKSELEVLRLVWKLGEATVRQVLDALHEDRKLDFWTVQTYLRRLESKSYLVATRLPLLNFCWNARTYVSASSLACIRKRPHAAECCFHVSMNPASVRPKS